MNEIVFSAIIPTYNRAAYVTHAIQSVLDQQLPDGTQTEVIVVDDESTDNTREVVAQFGAINIRSLCLC